MKKSQIALTSALLLGTRALVKVKFDDGAPMVIKADRFDFSVYLRPRELKQKAQWKRERKGRRS